jgi:hypothetical protein
VRRLETSDIDPTQQQLRPDMYVDPADPTGSDSDVSADDQ